MSLGRFIFGGLEALRRLRHGEDMSEIAASAGRIYSFEMKTNAGTLQSLAEFKGQALLIVNTASECGFTPQYQGLQELYARFKDRGLRVLAFPANEFGAQEPGTDAQIKTFCSSRWGVTFDLFAKIAVKGPGIHPLYRFLTTESGHNGNIPWNFAKFLVSRDGRVVARWGPDTEPLSEEIVRRVEGLLAEKT